VQRSTQRLRFTSGPSYAEAMMRGLTAALVEIFERLDRVFAAAA
jgi:5-aminolevulinate synthase